MDQSIHLVTAQVQFMEDRLALVHIPRHLGDFFLKAILQVLYYETSVLDENGHEIRDENGDRAELESQPSFLNISITPVECSVMCPRSLAERFFAPLVKLVDNEASITKDDFIAMQVYGEGLEAGQRVLELTSPLAMAGISIFFVSTYFSDYIVVPYRSKAQVIQALEKRGFQFETSTESFASPPLSNQCFSPSPSRTASPSPPCTPPPSTLDELQTRTFSSLRKNHIVPGVDTCLRLVQCAAHRRYTSTASSITILRDALTTTLIVDNPRFLSLTLAAADPAASLLLEQRLLPRFFPGGSPAQRDEEDDDERGLLLGSKDNILIPITLDLRNLPLEASGIVCGVANRLAEATHDIDTDQDTAEDQDTTNQSLSLPSSSVAGTPVQASSFDSYKYMKSVFSPAGSTDSGGQSHNRLPQLVPSTHLLHHLQPDTGNNPVEISFLSTARAGTILVGEFELRRAVRALEAEAERQDDVGMDDVNASDDDEVENGEDYVEKRS